MEGISPQSRRSSTPYWHLLATSQLVLVLILSLSVLFSIVAILLPLFGTAGAARPTPGRWGFRGYFAALGADLDSAEQTGRQVPVAPMDVTDAHPLAAALGSRNITGEVLDVGGGIEMNRGHPGPPLAPPEAGHPIPREARRPSGPGNLSVRESSE